MKQILLDVPAKDKTDIPIDAVLSFKPFEEYVTNKLQTDTTIKRQLYAFVAERLKKMPSLDGPVNLEDLPKYTELFELIYASLTGITSEKEESLWALSIPLRPAIIYGTDAFYELMIDKTECFINDYVENDKDENEKRKEALVYSLILKKFYDYKLLAKDEIIHYYTDPSTGLYKFYRIHIDPRFVKITPKEPLPSINLRRLEKNPHSEELGVYLKRVLPLSMFNFEGFSIIHLTDVTEQYTVQNIKNSILQASSKPKDEGIADIKQTMKTMVGCSNIDFGFIPLATLNEKPLLEFGTLSNSVLLTYGYGKIISIKDFNRLVKDYMQMPRAIFIKDVDTVKNPTDPFVKTLKAAGVKSFALQPLFFNNQLTGVMEVYNRMPGMLDEHRLSKLDAALPHLAQLIKAAVDDFQHKIANIVNEKFTAIQPSVQWKFYEAAWHYMQQRFEQRKEPLMEQIIFKKVYPLYGAIDIRNSSIERNNATRKDLIYNLELLVETFEKLKQLHPLALIDEMVYKTKKWITALQESLSPAEEYKLDAFLEQEAMPLLEHLKKIKPAAIPVVDKYLAALDEETGKANEHRRNLESSMQLINQAIINYLDLMKTELQQSYPCYFEKFRTDGIEYDIYIGQSIAPSKPFDILYLRNLRLWQLKSMAAIYKMVQGLEPQMARLLHITQLIFINADTIDISFRNDEKRFDVEGAYNIRYQVIKKRIDKVHVKNSNERLTQPGKIALVYFNDKEAEEYVSYINFLQEQGVLKNDLEFLELEELQGVAGLKALRVGIE